MTTAIYPSYASETKTFPVLEVAMATRIPFEKTDFLWLLQQAIGDAKFALLQQEIDKHTIAVGPINVDIQISLSQRVVSDEATEGRAISLPEGMQYFTVSFTKEPWRL